VTADHPLDRAVWLALTGAQAGLAITHGNARRFDPAYGVFAAIADRSDASLADLGELVGRYGDVAFLGPDPPTDAPGVEVASQDLGVQMAVRSLTPGPEPRHGVVNLTDADAPAMLELASLTQPGPFFEKTHQLGDFVGIKEDGRLIAMAGERMKPTGFTEVSAICTHPDCRGRGLAAELTRIVVGRIVARGETPFLHAYASNTAAIALYERLGFSIRREVLMTRLTAA
jgi:predicted GNAT family acetyltransferase